MRNTRVFKIRIKVTDTLLFTSVGHFRISSTSTAASCVAPLNAILWIVRSQVGDSTV